MDGVYLRLLAVHVQCGQLIVNKFHSYCRQRRLLLKLTDSPLHVLHDHLSVSAHMECFCFLTFQLQPSVVNVVQNVCMQLLQHIQKGTDYLPVFPSDSHHVRFLTGQKPLEIFNVVGLRMKHISE